MLYSAAMSLVVTPTRRDRTWKQMSVKRDAPETACSASRKLKGDTLNYVYLATSIFLWTGIFYCIGLCITQYRLGLYRNDTFPRLQFHVCHFDVSDDAIYKTEKKLSLLLLITSQTECIIFIHFMLSIRLQSYIKIRLFKVLRFSVSDLVGGRP